MEDIIVKNTKRAQRRFNNAKHVIKQIKILKGYDMFYSYTVAGKYVKRNALSCGSSSCRHCMNPRKAYGHRTLKEEINEIVFKESMNDLDI